MKEIFIDAIVFHLSFKKISKASFAQQFKIILSYVYYFKYNY